MGEGVIVATLDGVGSDVGVEPQLSEMIRKINIKYRAGERYRIGFDIKLLQDSPAGKKFVH